MALFLFFYEFLVKIHKNTYESENLNHFQKSLILQAIQWYSRITANRYETIWPMEVGQVVGQWKLTYLTQILPPKKFNFVVKKKIVTY